MSRGLAGQGSSVVRYTQVLSPSTSSRRMLAQPYNHLHATRRFSCRSLRVRTSALIRVTPRKRWYFEPATSSRYT
ncbi:hypothetical protein D3C79_960110 [compost metagenome]